jgi:hypothetical protein
MGRILKVILPVALCLVVVASVALVGCGGGGKKALVAPDMVVSQYLKGSTADLDDAVINTMAEAGGESGFRSGTAASMYPTLHFSTAARDAMAKVLYPDYCGYDTTDITFAMLGATEQSYVDGAILASLTDAETAAVDTAVVGFIDRIETDMSDAVAPEETSAYEILAGVSATAADGWAADVAAGMDPADRFFVWLVKEAVVAYTPYGIFDDYYNALFGSRPATPTDAQYEAVARIAGEIFFTNGTASATYPVQADEQAEALYGKSYAACDEMQRGYVDAAVYAALPSAFSSDAERAAARDAMAAAAMAYGYITHDTYAECTGMEQAIVNQWVYSQYLGVYAPAPEERDYIDFAAVPGFLLGVGAQMTDALPLEQNIAYLTLYSKVCPAAAEGWVADVEAGVHYRQAFYRWLAKLAVQGMAAAAPLIRLSVAEFYITVTNPNEYWISLDSLDMNASTDIEWLPGSGTMVSVDMAKVAMGDKIWVPPMENGVEGEITIRILAPVKVYDAITWGMLAGYDQTKAGALATLAFNKIQDGTIAWDVDIAAVISAETGTISETYTLQWAPE